MHQPSAGSISRQLLTQRERTSSTLQTLYRTPLIRCLHHRHFKQTLFVCVCACLCVCVCHNRATAYVPHPEADDYSKYLLSLLAQRRQLQAEGTQQLLNDVASLDQHTLAANAQLHSSNLLMVLHTNIHTHTHIDAHTHTHTHIDAQSCTEIHTPAHKHIPVAGQGCLWVVCVCVCVCVCDVTASSQLRHT